MCLRSQLIMCSAGSRIQVMLCLFYQFHSYNWWAHSCLRLKYLTTCVCLTLQQGWADGLVCWSGQQWSPERTWRIRHILEVRQARKKHLASLRQLERQEPVPRRSETEMLASRRHLGKFWSKNSSHQLSAFFCTSSCVCVCVCIEEGKKCQKWAFS